MQAVLSIHEAVCVLSARVKTLERYIDNVQQLQRSATSAANTLTIAILKGKAEEEIIAVQAIADGLRGGLRGEEWA